MQPYAKNDGALVKTMESHPTESTDQINSGDREEAKGRECTDEACWYPETIEMSLQMSVHR